MSSTTDKRSLVAPVIRQLRELADRPQSPAAGGDVMHLRYETQRMVYEVSSTRPLPRQCDVKVYYYLMGVRQQQANNGGDPRRVHTTILNILRGCGMSKSRQNYENVEEALRRYNGLGIGTKRKDADEECMFNLFDAKITGRNVLVIFSELYLEILDEEDDSNCHFLAMEHVAGLTGLAIQLYSMMQTHLFDTKNTTRAYTENARLLTRKLFGEDRGREMAVSSALTHYVIPALERIERKTGWKINVAKEGRGNACRWTFSTDSVPYAFTVAGISKEEESKIRGKKADKEKTEKVAPATLSPAVLTAIPEAHRTDKALLQAFMHVVDQLDERHAILLAESVDPKKVKSYPKVIMGMKRDGKLVSRAEELASAPKSATFDEKMAKNYKFVISILHKGGEEAFQKMCRHRKLDPQKALSWAEANPDQDPRNKK